MSNSAIQFDATAKASVRAALLQRQSLRSLASVSTPAGGLRVVQAFPSRTPAVGRLSIRGIRLLRWVTSAPWHSHH